MAIIRHITRQYSALNNGKHERAGVAVSGADDRTGPSVRRDMLAAWDFGEPFSPHSSHALHDRCLDKKDCHR